MAEFSNKLKSELSEFLLNELGSKVLDGITYTMLTKSPNDKEDFERYNLIRREATLCGYDNDQVFRIVELQNGYIFDMDMSTAGHIISALSKPLINQEGLRGNIFDVVGTKPAEIRGREMTRLAKLLVDNLEEKGMTETKIALFNRNSSNRVMVSARTENNEQVVIPYKAFKIRHWDLAFMNKRLLVPRGYKITKMQPCEVLPSKTGVSFILTLEKI